MLVTLHNADLTVQISTHGAELTSIKGQNNQIEYLWQADAKYWGRHAPVLFPFVGRLKDDTYTYQGHSYHQGQHGFARDQEFEVTAQSETKALFTLTSSDQSHQIYPFDFRLRLSYELKGATILVGYQVDNPATTDMLFALGAHPAFNIPLTAQDNFETTMFKVDPAQEYAQIKLRGPYSDPENQTTLDLKQALGLNHNLFDQDALILNLQGQEVTLSLEGPSGHGVALKLQETPFVGIWSPYPTQAPFVCLEPWWGLADTITSDQALSHKFAINKLTGNSSWQAGFEMSFY
ncbi:aldose 1-epimerase family protein [Ligilactobacillus equi]|uniref:Aldose 1-epimerase n=2 Tax=Ligilactobacillus equi TaxID=137357 RepID=V7HYN2_9LACO|nr:aldose 1-epimerase family protein [Ligilactobacillus equi]ETA74385.1 aldose 1-epimerase [Ligilactobacillus equi DPC 6820]KRL79474.1 aldose 1-epimerase [Ligilactobacillus equi DSM 15833 = JCM 10991]MCQ2556535.1 aldose 1-epimerase family protein [Ligilactobacillus sp.]